uniref:Myb-like domain-containing protein n=1 Tax=Aegilops tauschii subsp. strangulata TaxID=200361 RepID=A0A453QEL1_AEGTS
ARVRPTRPIPRARSRPPIPTSFLADKAPSLRAPPPDNPMASQGATTAAWTNEEDKAFENAVASGAPPPLDGVPEECWFAALAASVPARSTEEVRRHYEALVEDVGAIDAGRVPLPRYAGEDSSAAATAAAPSKDRREDRKSFDSDSGKGCSKAEQERRKGIPWTEEEHRAVLAGAGQVRQGRLAEHLAQLRHLPDAHAGGQPRAEVLHPPQLHEPGPPPLQHPRHHQHQQRRPGRAAHHRPGPRRAGGAARGHDEASRDGGHVRRGAHGPPGRRPHGPRRRRHAGHVPAGAGPPALRHARRLPGSASVSMSCLLRFVRARGTPACA